jgi:ligand-binding SRPBCC domain-containing protein
MKIYTIKRTQILPVSMAEAWDFFSSPKNLAAITPAQMNFRIVNEAGLTRMYAGQLIRYKINVIPFITTNWVTEITHVQEPYYFVDEQRFGPYALWHHQHRFKEVPDGVEMTDEVNYAVPWGILGSLANWLFVGRQVNVIFEHRFQAVSNHFSKRKS